MADTVLIVDDDQAVATMLYKVIRSNGIEAETATSGEEALERTTRREYDPHPPGREHARHGRLPGGGNPAQAGLPDPPSSSSAAGRRTTTPSTALDIGADDYITKPFNPITLGAKVKALIRRSRGSIPGMGEELAAGPLPLQHHTFRFYKDGKEIVLSSKETAIMKLFLDNVNRIFSKDMIYDLVWGEAIIDENAIMVYINRLRQKIEDDPSHPRYIQTVRGLGYRFVPPARLNSGPPLGAGFVFSRQPPGKKSPAPLAPGSFSMLQGIPDLIGGHPEGLGHAALGHRRHHAGDAGPDRLHGVLRGKGAGRRLQHRQIGDGVAGTEKAARAGSPAAAAVPAPYRPW